MAQETNNQTSISLFEFLLFSFVLYIILSLQPPSFTAWRAAHAAILYYSFLGLLYV
jgi:hypothetical protein